MKEKRKEKKEKRKKEKEGCFSHPRAKTAFRGYSTGIRLE